MKTFYFDTGVKPYNHTPRVSIMPGNVVRGGTLQIPFDCENVPENATFLYACDAENASLDENIICREMTNTNMLSKFAYFRL